MRSKKKPRVQNKARGAAPEHEMLVLAFGNQKGGVGKTTLVINLAAALQRAGFVTTVLDLDPQKSAERYAEHRASLTGEEAPVVVHGTADNLKEMVETAREEGVEALLIDCPGALDRTLLLASAVADVIVVPTRSSILDQDSLADTLEFLQDANKIDKCLVVLNAARDGRDGGITDVRRIVSTFGATMTQTQIQDLRAFSVSLSKGKAVVEAGTRSPAAQSIEALLEEISAFHRSKVDAGKRS